MSDAAPSAGHTYRRLLGYAWRHWPVALLAFVAMTFEAGAAAAFTKLMEPLIDDTFTARDLDTVRWLPFAIVGIFIVRGIAVFVGDVGVARVGRAVVRDLRGEVLEHYLRLPSRYFDREPPASLVARLTFNAEQVYQASSDAGKVLVTDTLTIIFLVAVMLSESVQLTLAILLLAPVIGLIVNTVGRRFRRIARQIQGGVGRASEIAEEAVSAQQSVKVYGGEAHESARYHVENRRLFQLYVKVTATNAVSTALVQILAAVALALIVWLGARQALAGALTAGEFMVVMTSMLALLPSLKRITSVQGMIQRGVAAAASLFEVLDQPVEEDRGTHAVARARGAVEFRGVHLRYDEGAPPEQAGAALRGVDLVCAPGTVTALVGRSGSGKTSLVRLLPRFYEPSEGAVLLDGVPLTEYPLPDLRRQIALVSQRVDLFDDTVAANIAYGALRGAPHEDIVEAARAANALEFIERLPDGFDTRVGVDGARLSGGQRQRLAIARAILKDAPVLILDEATSALDTESERLVQDALARIMRDRTTLVIAHRLSTIEHADQVVVMDAGRIVERGTHAELLNRGGLYAHLHGMQFRETVSQA